MQIYRKIAADIETAITSGALQPGARIPFEHELMARYGCARMTVSKALSGLVARGLITRRRKAGSVVALPRAEKAVLEIHDFALEATRAGQQYRHDILDRRLVRLDRAGAERSGLGEGGAYLHLVTLHQIDGRPEAYEDRLISLTNVPEARDEPFLELPPGTWLLQRVPWTDAEHVIRSMTVSATIRRRLAMHEEASALVIERRTWHAGRILTRAEIIYPSDRHKLTARFTAGGAPDTSSASSL